MREAVLDLLRLFFGGKLAVREGGFDGLAQEMRLCKAESRRKASRSMRR